MCLLALRSVWNTSRFSSALAFQRLPLNPVQALLSNPLTDVQTSPTLLLVTAPTITAF